MYVIGKATRHKAGGVVMRPPYDVDVPEDVYQVLRSAIYTSREHAEVAATIAEKYNPVGFVVLQLDMGV